MIVSWLSRLAFRSAGVGFFLVLSGAAAALARF